MTTKIWSSVGKAHNKNSWHFQRFLILLLVLNTKGFHKAKFSFCFGTQGWVPPFRAWLCQGFISTIRCGLLRKPFSGSLGGLCPLAKVFFYLFVKKSQSWKFFGSFFFCAIYAFVVPLFLQHWCSLTLATNVDSKLSEVVPPVFFKSIFFVIIV